MLSEKCALLDYAISKLRPEVFSHPVWVRFSNKDKAIPPETIQDLFCEAEQLQHDNPGEACQILLICAVYQNYAGRHDNALTTLQQVLALAKRTNLAREILWANWGACAICFQQGDYEQASSHLDDVQVALSQQNEWVLADFVDMIKQFLLRPVTEGHSEIPIDQPLDDLVRLTFIWLQQWGFSLQFPEAEFGRTSGNPSSVSFARSNSTPSFFSVQRWKGYCQTLALIFKGKLRLRWVENDGPRKKRRLSFWKSILNPLPSHGPDRKTDIEVIENTPQIPGIPTLLRPKENSHLKVTAPSSARISKVSKAQRNRQSEQATNLISIAVHMLGAFGMTIGDLTVKLPLSRSLSLLKYLLLHHKQNIPREVLMDVFWPDADPETARNDLNVTMHSLRKALRSVIFLPMIVFADGAYGLEPDLQVWLDVEEFEKCIQAGQRLEARNQLTAAVAEYESAISLYQGDFLEQTPYEEWMILDRERLRIAYLNSLDRLSQIYFSQERYAACITVCQFILSRDRCREDAHCLLMRCYSRQGQYYLALRQYQTCVEALRAELEVGPATETTQLYERMRRRERV